MVSRSSLRSQQGSQPGKKPEMDAKKPASKKKKEGETKKIRKGAAATKKGSKKKCVARKSKDFSRSIFKVLRLGDPKPRISCKAMFIMNSLMVTIYDRIVKEAKRLQKGRHSETLDACDIQSATRSLIPGELGQHAMAEGIKAVILINHNQTK